MRGLAKELGLPASDIDFQYDTFEILAVAREYYLGAFDEAIVQRLQLMRQAYREHNHPCY